MRISQWAEVSPVDDAAQEHSSAHALPGWLREKYATTISTSRAEVVKQAKRGLNGQGENDAGIIADQRIKGILSAAGLRLPSAATAAAYRRDHTNMLAAKLTPADKAATFQHFNRLRGAWKYGEIEAIRALRRGAEAARKSKDYAYMRSLTVEAYDRAVVLDAMFLTDLSAPSRQTWGRKAATLRAAGSWMISGKSKRAAGRTAPTPDQLLVLLSHQRKRCARVEIAAAIFACFGIRPAELRSGVRLFIDADALGLEVRGAKVDALRGQPSRQLRIMPGRFGRSGIAVGLLRDEVAAGRCLVQLTSAGITAVCRAMRTVQNGLSPYAFRHARASDAKAWNGRLGAAAWLGHRTDRAQTGYGNRRSSSGAVKIRAAAGTHLVRRVKSLPGNISVPVAAASMRKVATPSPCRRPRIR